MRVFLTGGTGFIGSAILHNLITSGREVLALARNQKAGERLSQMGASVLEGDLSDLDAVAAGAGSCDGVIHTAFGHDFSKYVEAGETDRNVVEAMARALDGTGKPLVITSGTMLLAPGRVGSESDAASPDSPSAVRLPSEEAVLSAAARGVRSSVVRLAPSVHGPGDHGFVPQMITTAREKGFSAFIGDGANRWPAVHCLDAARLFCLALDKAEPGTRLHGAAEEGIPMCDLAAEVAKGLDLPLRSIGEEEAQEHFGWLAMAIKIDNPVTSAITRSTVGWTPTEQGLIEDLRSLHYFDAA